MSRRSDWWSSLEPWFAMDLKPKSGNGLSRTANMRSQMNTRIYVSNLPESTTEDSLRAAFVPFGAITKIFVATDRDTALPAYAFVTYGTAEDMTASIAGMNDATFEGRKLAVSVAREAKIAPAPKRFVPPPSFGQRRGPGGPPRSVVRR
jgi:cold-inducible RNA-binding protein